MAVICGHNQTEWWSMGKLSVARDNRDRFVCSFGLLIVFFLFSFLLYAAATSLCVYQSIGAAEKLLVFFLSFSLLTYLFDLENWFQWIILL